MSTEEKFIYSKEEFLTLKASMTDLHALASGSLQRITGMARCALRALETPSGARDLEAVAQVLIAIAIDAEMILNDIDFEAERNRINTSCKEKDARTEAMVRAQEGGAA